MDKICCRCKELKNITEFNKAKRNKDGLANACKKCSSVYNKQWRTNNPEKSKISQEKWLKNNLERKKEYLKKYYKSNSNKSKEYTKNYKRERYKNDILFKLSCKLRHFIWKSLNKKQQIKSKKCLDVLGCSLEQFKNHIESLFLNGMNWENIGKWHVDHIKPISLGNTEEEIYKLNHYTNFQPLWAKDNLKKSNKYEK
jgi:hypothetical protein